MADARLRRAERDGTPEEVRLHARRAGLDPWRELRDALRERALQLLEDLGSRCPCERHVDLLWTRGQEDLQVLCGQPEGWVEVGRLRLTMRGQPTLEAPDVLAAAAQGPEDLRDLVVERLLAIARWQTPGDHRERGRVPWRLEVPWEEVLRVALARSQREAPPWSPRTARALQRLVAGVHEHAGLVRAPSGHPLGLHLSDEDVAQEDLGD